MKYDRKTQMMDAGMAFFESSEGMGNVMGIVKAQLEYYGKVVSDSQIEPDSLPSSTGAFTFFMDWSSPWRTRYISCLVEDAGDTGKQDAEGRPVRRYAVSFKEGSRSSKLRACTYIFMTAAFLCLMVMQNFLLHGFRFMAGFACFALAAYTAYLWCVPSHKAQKTVKGLIASLLN